MGQLDGKVAIVTGGGSGFGRGVCLEWAKEGALVVVAELNPNSGNAVVEEISGSGGRGLFVQTDVTSAQDCKALVDRAVQTFGRVDVLYNNAAILGPRSVPLHEFDDAVAEKLLQVNIMGVYLPTKHVIPALIKGGGGSIISTGSDSAYRGNATFSVYSGTKSWVIGFSRVVAIEYVDYGIRANTVSPGVGRTPMQSGISEEIMQDVEKLIPMKRAAQPLDIARAATFFASDASSYITGQNIMVDGGFTAKGYYGAS